MSDSLPEKDSSEVLKVLKLVSGEEVIGLITEANFEFITLKFPAILGQDFSKDEQGNIIEYVRLMNYISHIENNTIEISKKVIIYLGEPAIELKAMYGLYQKTMETDPKSLLNGLPDTYRSPEPGLHLLNDLFNNEDFVGFVNDLIDTFEGIEITEEMEEMLEEAAETDIEPPEPKTPKQPSKRKKRRTVKPETNKLPYNPEAPPNTPEGWSDNPQDYI